MEQVRKQMIENQKKRAALPRPKPTTEQIAKVHKIVAGLNQQLQKVEK